MRKTHIGSYIHDTRSQQEFVSPSTEDRWWHARSKKKLTFELKLRQNPANELHYLLIAIFQYIGPRFFTLLDHEALQQAPIACSIQEMHNSV